MAHKGGGGICKRWQKHDIELGMKGKVIFSGRVLYLEADGLRGKRPPLILLSGGKHWYALSMAVSIDKQVCECTQLIMLSSGKLLIGFINVRKHW